MREHAEKRCFALIQTNAGAPTAFVFAQMRAVRNLALGAAGTAGALKGLQLLANDDLDDVEYALNKLKARVLS